MRQAGFIAAAGIYALQNNLDRLAEDHLHARQIGEAIVKKSFVEKILPVETNIIIFELKEGLPAPKVVATLKENDILSYAIAPNRVRLVVHLDISKEMVAKTIQVFNQL